MTYTLTDYRPSDDHYTVVFPESNSGRTIRSHTAALNGYQMRMVRNNNFGTQFEYRPDYLIAGTGMAGFKFHGAVLAHHYPSQLAYMFGEHWRDIVDWLKDKHGYSLESPETTRNLHHFQQPRDQLQVMFAETQRARPSSGALGNMSYTISNVRNHMRADGNTLITPRDLDNSMMASDVRDIGRELFEVLKYMGIHVEPDAAEEASLAAGYAVMAMVFSPLQNVVMESVENGRMLTRAEERYTTERARRRVAEDRVAAIESENSRRQRVMDTAAQFATAETAQEKLEAFRSMMLLVDEASVELEAAQTTS